MKKNKDLSITKKGPLPSGKGMSMGIVVSDWNKEITHAMLTACRDTLIEAGVESDDIHICHVPGTFELPFGAKTLLGQKKLDAVICIGCVIKGETDHDKYINQAVSTGIMHLGLTSGKPVIFGVLTPNNMEQALDRAGGKYGNKGVEAATTAIYMAALGKEDKSGKIGF